MRPQKILTPYGTEHIFKCCKISNNWEGFILYSILLTLTVFTILDIVYQIINYRFQEIPARFASLILVYLGMNRVARFLVNQSIREID